jgi:catechol 2,3-dioxygenase-like lactoylglutathione lyase family enzyme
MLRGIDHAVILVPDLDAAVEAYARLGFTVVPGGRHNVATHNALIAFQDGAYIELIAFWEHAPAHRWHRFLALGGGLVDYCMRTDNLDADVEALRSAGIAMSERQPMSRPRPDGYRLEWSLSLATGTQGITPFLIEDATPREERLPRQDRHANGVTGISRLTIAVRDLSVATRLSALLGEGRPIEEHGGKERGVRFVSGGHRLEFLEAARDGPMAAHIAGRGGGVFALTLKTSRLEAVIDPAQTLNVRLSLVRG